MLYKGCIGVKKAARSPEGGPAEIGGLSASNLPLISIPHLARIPDGPAKAGEVSVDFVCPRVLVFLIHYILTLKNDCPYYFKTEKGLAFEEYHYRWLKTFFFFFLTMYNEKGCKLTRMNFRSLAQKRSIIEEKLCCMYGRGHRAINCFLFLSRNQTHNADVNVQHLQHVHKYLLRK